MKNIILFIFVCVFAVPSFASKYFVDARGAYAALEDAKKVDQRIVDLNSLDIVVQAGLYDKKTKESRIVFPGDYWEILDSKIIFVTKNSVLAEITFDNQKQKIGIFPEVAAVQEIKMTPREQVLFLFSYMGEKEMTENTKSLFNTLVQKESSFKKIAAFFLAEFDQGRDDCIGSKDCFMATYGLEEMINKFYLTETQHNVSTPHILFTEKENTTDYASSIEQPTPVRESIINSE